MKEERFIGFLSFGGELVGFFILFLSYICLLSSSPGIIESDGYFFVCWIVGCLCSLLKVITGSLGFSP